MIKFLLPSKKQYIYIFIYVYTCVFICLFELPDFIQCCGHMEAVRWCDHSQTLIQLSVTIFDSALCGVRAAEPSVCSVRFDCFDWTDPV